MENNGFEIKCLTTIVSSNICHEVQLTRSPNRSSQDCFKRLRNIFTFGWIVNPILKCDRNPLPVSSKSSITVVLYKLCAQIKNGDRFVCGLIWLIVFLILLYDFLFSHHIPLYHSIYRNTPLYFTSRQLRVSDV